MKDILIYTTRGCPYCIVAKRALDGRGIPYREIDITRTPHVRDELKARTGEWTVPQVFVDGAYIGQDDELVALAASGALDAPEAETPAVPPAAPGEGPAWDVAVIGAGGAGLALAARLAPGLRVLVLDRAPHVPRLDPQIDHLRDAARAAGATVRLEEVFGLEAGAADHGLVTLGAVVRARAVVVATGRADRTPALPGEAALHGKGVSHCAACDAPFFTGLPVAVVGSDARAAEAALLLADKAASVDLVSPAAGLAIADATRGRLKAAPNLRLHPDTRPRAIRGEGHVTGLEVTGPEGPARLEVAGVFLYLPGDRPGTGFLHDAVAKAPDGAVRVSPEGETSRPGVFALGAAAGGAPDDLEAACARVAEALARRLAAR